MPDAMRNDMSGLETVAAFQLYTPKVTIKAGDKVVKTFDKTDGGNCPARLFRHIAIYLVKRQQKNIA